MYIYFINTGNCTSLSFTIKQGAFWERIVVAELEYSTSVRVCRIMLMTDRLCSSGGIEFFNSNLTYETYSNVLLSISPESTLALIFSVQTRCLVCICAGARWWLPLLQSPWSTHWIFCDFLAAEDGYTWLSERAGNSTRSCSRDFRSPRTSFHLSYFQCQYIKGSAGRVFRSELCHADRNPWRTMHFCFSENYRCPSISRAGGEEGASLI